MTVSFARRIADEVRTTFGSKTAEGDEAAAYVLFAIGVSELEAAEAFRKVDAMPLVRACVRRRAKDRAYDRRVAETLLRAQMGFLRGDVAA